LKGRVFIAGTGVISAIGNSLPETAESFKKHRSGIGPITLFETIHQDTLPVGEVKLTDDQLAKKLELPAAITRTALLGISAAKEALANSGLASLRQFRTGFISATTVGGMDRTEYFFEEFLRDRGEGRLRDVVNHECGRSTECIADALEINGYLSTINTACSSSVNSIIFGSRMIAAGMLDVVVAGGTDSLTKFTLNGFNSLMILDKAPCRPFDNGRAGLNLGEGAGYVVLVSEEVARSQKLAVKTFVSGFANTNDAYHQTASSPEGRGSYAAMEKALQTAGLSVDDISYINLHGTGTVNNDQSEGTAVQRLFGKRMPAASSTKSFTGHTLGACGGLEAAFSIMAIENNWLLPNLRFQTKMTDIDITPVTQFTSGVEVRHVMSNSFGFGGNCSSIIFSRV
jgi:3-oxoacyl-(acyl-carrier-protein) synthase